MREAFPLAAAALPQLLLAVGLEVEEMPGDVRDLAPSDGEARRRLHHATLAPQGQAGDALERFARVDGLHDLAEGDLALAQHRRVEEPGLEHELGRRRWEPTTD